VTLAFLEAPFAAAGSGEVEALRFGFLVVAFLGGMLRRGELEKPLLEGG